MDKDIEEQIAMFHRDIEIIGMNVLSNIANLLNYYYGYEKYSVWNQRM